jgi:peptidoglycan hydrolase-like protein with peptidoglycan-binding domain
MMGENSHCVQELQERLQAHGFDLPADAWFGPYTRTRVMAFQVMSGLPSTAIVDEQVKRALYADSINAPFWPRAEVKRSLREAFPEDPAGAVQLATCLSQLDPYWITNALDGSRRWGLFQFSDRELIAFGVESRVALDLPWNVRAARSVWSRTGDFRHWKCAPPV